MANRIIWNGKYAEEKEPVVTASSRGLRYGDGLFETMRIADNQILHADIHFERLFQGMRVLGFGWPLFFSPEFLSEQVLALAVKNGHQKNARVRLAVFRGEGGVFDPENDQPNWLIQTSEIAPIAPSIQENGLVLGIYREARKSADHFSALKNNNFLPYLMAARFAKKAKWNDALLLNAFDQVTDSTIANVFWVEGDRVLTPPLSQGPVAGTARKRLLLLFQKKNIISGEETCTPDRILAADAIFLTNAISAIRWVSSLEGRSFAPGRAGEFYRWLTATI